MKTSTRGENESWYCSVMKVKVGAYYISLPSNTWVTKGLWHSMKSSVLWNESEMVS